MGLNKRDFIFNWLLQNEIALGNAPLNKQNIDLLKEKGIKAILNLCYSIEYEHPKNIFEYFEYKHMELPDHRSRQKISKKQIFESLEIIKKLKKQGPIFIHCMQSVERSPLICMAWLIFEKKLSLDDALEYLMRIHKTTNPTNEQLLLLREISLNIKS